MGSNKNNEALHIVFFPFMAQGHLIPATHMAKLFASRGQRSTIITTSHFVKFLAKTVTGPEFGSRINVETVKLDLPEEMDSMHKCTTPDMQQKFFEACGLLGPQTAEILRRRRPDCLVADMFFPWATDLGVPTLVFHGTSCFSLCVSLSVFLNKPYATVASESEPFPVPNLPDNIELTRSRIPEFVKDDDGSPLTKLFSEIRRTELKAFGILVNSFRELEPGYAECYRDVFGRNAWHIGPLFLYGKNTSGDGDGDGDGDRHECLKWLDAKKPDSVVYVSFGSMANFTDEQLLEIAAGLEASEKEFVWVVKREKKGDDVAEEWLPEGFEARVGEKGMIVRGWAPQVAILEHPSVGVFVTHCGWNSTLESVCAGVPMVTWPVSAEQFYNEKLVVQVLGIGTEVGAKKWRRLVGDFVGREALERAVKCVMDGSEAGAMRRRVRELAEMARRAVRDGGSSVSDLDRLFEDLRRLRGCH